MDSGPGTDGAYSVTRPSHSKIIAHATITLISALISATQPRVAAREESCCPLCGGAAGGGTGAMRTVLSSTCTNPTLPARQPQQRLLPVNRNGKR